MMEVPQTSTLVSSYTHVADWVDISNAGKSVIYLNHVLKAKFLLRIVSSSHNAMRIQNIYRIVKKHGQDDTRGARSKSIDTYLSSYRPQYLSRH